MNSALRLVLLATQPASPVTAANAVVDAGGSGDYTTLAAAEAALTAPFLVLVKSGTYAGATLAKAPATWIFEPGCVINTTALTVTGNKVAVILMPGCDVQVAYTHSGTDGYVEGRNGVAGLSITLSGARGAADGGGWGSILSSTRSDLSGADCIFRNLASSGQNAFGTVSGGGRAVFSGIYNPGAGGDNYGIYVHSGDDTLILGSMTAIRRADEAALRLRMIGSSSLNVASVSFSGAADSDWVDVGNIQQAGHGTIQAGDTNHVVVGNRIDGAPTDSDGSSTITANDLTGF